MALCGRFGFRSREIIRWEPAPASRCHKKVMVLRALHLAVRAFLVLACAFWALAGLEIFPALFAQGLDGARAKLFHIWSLGNLDLASDCVGSLRLLHEGYTDLIIFILLTWMLVELNRFLRRRIAAARSESIPNDGSEPYSFDNISGRKP